MAASLGTIVRQPTGDFKRDFEVSFLPQEFQGDFEKSAFFASVWRIVKASSAKAPAV